MRSKSSQTRSEDAHIHSNDTRCLGLREPGPWMVDTVDDERVAVGEGALLLYKGYCSFTWPTTSAGRSKTPQMISKRAV